MSYTEPVKFPEFGPNDTAAAHDAAAARAALLRDYGASWCGGYATAWHTGYRRPYFWPPHAQSAADLRGQGSVAAGQRP